MSPGVERDTGFMRRHVGSRRSALVVDDDDELLDVLTEVLTAADFDVSRACDGIDALSFLYANRPRVLRVDLTMPKMDGVELIEQVRSDPRLTLTFPARRRAAVAVESP